jgi:hypothetical protein
VNTVIPAFERPAGFNEDEFLAFAARHDQDPQYQAFIKAYADGEPPLPGGEMAWDEFDAMIAQNVERMKTPEYAAWAKALAEP